MDTQQIPADTNFADKNTNIANIKNKINKMPKKIIVAIIIAVAVILLAGLAVGGYYGWKIWKGGSSLSSEIKILEEIGNAAEKITESALKGVLPSIQTNPLENKPDLNPADKANPFKNIKTNPFE